MAEPTGRETREPGTATTRVSPQAIAFVAGLTSGRAPEATAPAAAPVTPAPESDDDVTGWLGPALRTPSMSLPLGKAYQDLLTAEASGRAGFVEGITPGLSDLPFVGDAIAGLDVAKVPYTLSRLKKGEAVDDADLLELNYFIKHTQREGNRTFGGDIGAGIRGLFQFGAEFATTAALVGAGLLAAPVSGGTTAAAAGAVAAGTAAKKGAVKAAQEAAKKAVAGFVERGARRGVERGLLAQKWVGSKAAFDAARREVGESMRNLVMDAVGKTAARKLAPVAGRVAAVAGRTAAPAAAMLTLDEAANIVAAGVSGNAPITLPMVNREMDQVLRGGEVDPVSAKMYELGDRFVEYWSEMTGPELGKLFGMARRAAGAGATAVAPNLVNAAEDAGRRFADWGRKFWGEGLTKTAGELTDEARRFVADKNWKMAAGAYLGAISAKYGVDIDAAVGIMKASGYDGFLKEMGEERIGGFVRGLTGIQGDSAGLANAWDQMWPAAEDLAVEAVVFATPLALAGSTHVVQNTQWAGGQGIRGLYKDFREMRRLLSEQKDTFESAEERQKAMDATLALIRTPAMQPPNKAKGIQNVLNFVGSLARFDVMGAQFSNLDEVMMAHGLPALTDAYRRVYDNAKASGSEDTAAHDAAAAAVEETLAALRGTEAVPEKEQAEELSRIAAKGDEGLKTEKYGGYRVVTRDPRAQFDAALTAVLDKLNLRTATRNAEQYLAWARAVGIAPDEIDRVINDPNPRAEDKVRLMYRMGMNPQDKVQWNETFPTMAAYLRGVNAARRAAIERGEDVPDIRYAASLGAIEDTLPNLLKVFSSYKEDTLRPKLQEVTPEKDGKPAVYRAIAGASNFVENGRRVVTWALFDSFRENPETGQRTTALYHGFEDTLEAGGMSQDVIDTVAASVVKWIESREEVKGDGALLEVFGSKDPGVRREYVGKLLSRELLWRQNTGHGEPDLAFSKEMEAIPLLEGLTTVDVVSKVQDAMAAALRVTNWAEAQAVFTNPFARAGGKVVGDTGTPAAPGGGPAPTEGGPLRSGARPDKPTPGKPGITPVEPPAELDARQLDSYSGAELVAWLRANAGVKPESGGVGTKVGIRFGAQAVDAQGRRLGKSAGGVLLAPDTEGFADDLLDGRVPVFVRLSKIDPDTGKPVEDTSLRSAADVILDTPRLRAKLRNAPSVDVVVEADAKQESAYAGVTNFASRETANMNIMDSIPHLSARELDNLIDSHTYRLQDDRIKGKLRDTMTAELSAMKAQREKIRSPAAARTPPVEAPVPEVDPNAPSMADALAAGADLTEADVREPVFAEEVVPDAQEETRREETLLTDQQGQEPPVPADIRRTEDDISAVEPGDKPQHSISDANQALVDRVNARMKQLFPKGIPPKYAMNWRHVAARLETGGEFGDDFKEALAALDTGLEAANATKLGALLRDAGEAAQEAAPAAAAPDTPDADSARGDQSFDATKTLGLKLSAFFREHNVSEVNRTAIITYFGGPILGQARRAGDGASSVLRAEAQRIEAGQPLTAALLNRIADRLNLPATDPQHLMVDNLVSMDVLFQGRIVPHWRIITGGTAEAPRVTVSEYTGDVRRALAPEIAGAVLRNFTSTATAKQWLDELVAAHLEDHKTKGHDARGAVLTRMYGLPRAGTDPVSPVLRAVMRYGTQESNYGQVVTTLGANTLTFLRAWPKTEVGTAEARQLASRAYAEIWAAREVPAYWPDFDRDGGLKRVVNKAGEAKTMKGPLQLFSSNLSERSPLLKDNVEGQQFVRGLLAAPSAIIGPHGKRISTFMQDSSTARALRARGFAEIAMLAGGTAPQFRKVDATVELADGSVEDVKETVRETEGFDSADLPNETLNAGIREFWKQRAPDGTFLAWTGNWGENDALMMYRRPVMEAKDWAGSTLRKEYEAWHKLIPASWADRLMLSVEAMDKLAAENLEEFNYALGIWEAQAAAMGRPDAYKDLATFRKRLSVRQTPTMRFLSGVEGGLPDVTRVAVFEDPQEKLQLVGENGEIVVDSTDGVTLAVGDVGERAVRSVGRDIAPGTDSVTLKTLFSEAPQKTTDVARIGKEHLVKLDDVAAAFPQGAFAAMKAKIDAMPADKRPHFVRFTSAAKVRNKNSVTPAPQRDGKTGVWTAAVPVTEDWALADLGLIFDPRHSTAPEMRRVPRQFTPSMYAVMDPGFRAALLRLRQDFEDRAAEIQRVFDAVEIDADGTPRSKRIDALRTLLAELEETLPGLADDYNVQGILRGERPVGPQDVAQLTSYVTAHFNRQIAFTGPMVQNVLKPSGDPSDLQPAIRRRITDTGMTDIPASAGFDTAADGVRSQDVAANVDGVRVDGEVNFNADGSLQDWGTGPAAQVQATEADALRAAAIQVFRRNLIDYMTYEDNGERRQGWQDLQSRLEAGEAVPLTELRKFVRLVDLDVGNVPGGFSALIRGEPLFWMRVPSQGLSTVGTGRLKKRLPGGANQAVKSSWAIKVAGEDFDVDKSYLMTLPRSRKTGRIATGGRLGNITSLYLYLSQKFNTDLKAFQLGNQPTDPDVYVKAPAGKKSMVDAYRELEGVPAPLMTREGALQSRELMADGNASLERTAAFSRTISNAAAAGLQLVREDGSVYARKVAFYGDFWDPAQQKFVREQRTLVLGGVTQESWQNVPPALWDHLNTILNMGTDYGKQDGALRYLVTPDLLPVANFLMFMNADLMRPGVTRADVRRYFATVIGFLKSPSWNDVGMQEIDKTKLNAKQLASLPDLIASRKFVRRTIEQLRQGFLELQNFLNAADQHVRNFADLVEARKLHEEARTKGIVAVKLEGAKKADPGMVLRFDTPRAFFEPDGSVGPFILRHDAYFKLIDSAYGTDPRAALHPAGTALGRALAAAFDAELAKQRIKGRGTTFNQKQQAWQRFEGRLASIMVVNALQQSFPKQNAAQLGERAVELLTELQAAHPDHPLGTLLEATTAPVVLNGQEVAFRRPALLEAIRQTAGLTPALIDDARKGFDRLLTDFGGDRRKGTELQTLLAFFGAALGDPWPGAVFKGNLWNFVTHAFVKRAVESRTVEVTDPETGEKRTESRVAPVIRELQRWRRGESTDAERARWFAFLSTPTRGMTAMYAVPPHAEEPPAAQPEPAVVPPAPPAPAPQEQAPAGRVVLPNTSPYTAKDQVKSDKATKFIGRGSTQSSTAAYAAAWGTRANSGSYTSADVVFVSAEGDRRGRVAPDFEEIQRALDAGATIITDSAGDRGRSYNRGEREVADYLASHGYVEAAPGTWTRPAAPAKAPAPAPTPAPQGTVEPGTAQEYEASKARVEQWAAAATPPKMSTVRMDHSVDDAKLADHSSARFWTQEQVDTGSAMQKWFAGPEQEALLEGPAGSGKTTLLNKVLRDMRSSGRLRAEGIVLGALAHRAKSVAQRLTQYRDGDAVYQYRAGVIDQLVFEKEEGGQTKLAGMLFSKQGPRPQLVVIDEASMVNTPALARLRKAVQVTGAKLLFVGDRLQIPPVESELRDGRKVLGVWDFFASRQAQHFRLTQVMRQAHGNPIAVEISRVREALERGEQFTRPDQMPAETLVDFHQGLVRGTIALPGAEGQRGIVAWARDIFKEGGNEMLLADPNLFRVLTWRNENVGAYNAAIRRMLRPDARYPFEKGDLVVGYSQRGASEGEVQLMNGADYVVTEASAPHEIDKVSYDGSHHQMQVITATLREADRTIIGEPLEFETNIVLPVSQAQYEAWLRPYVAALDDAKAMGYWSRLDAIMDELKSATAEVLNSFVLSQNVRSKNARGLTEKALDYAYALTFHKSQGGSFKYIGADAVDAFRPTPGGGISTEVGNLLYTGLTRAVYATMVASPNPAAKMLTRRLFVDLTRSVVKLAQPAPAPAAPAEAQPSTEPESIRPAGIYDVAKVGEYERHAKWVRPTGAVVNIRYSVNKDGEITHVMPIKGSTLSADDLLDLKQALLDRPADEVERGEANDAVNFSLAQAFNGRAFTKAQAADPKNWKKLLPEARRRWARTEDRVEKAADPLAARRELEALERETKRASPHLRWDPVDTAIVLRNAVYPLFRLADEGAAPDADLREDANKRQAEAPDTGEPRIDKGPPTMTQGELDLSLDDAVRYYDAVATRFGQGGVAALHRILQKELSDLAALRWAESRKYAETAIYQGAWKRYRDHINPLKDGKYTKEKVEWTREDHEIMRQRQYILKHLMEHFPSGAKRELWDRLWANDAYWGETTAPEVRDVVTGTMRRDPPRLARGVAWGYALPGGIPSVENFRDAMRRIESSAAYQKLLANGRTFDLFAELQDARAFYDKGPQMLPWLIKKRDRYIQHRYGNGFVGQEMQKALDAVAREIELRTSRKPVAADTLMNDEAVYERDFTKGVPPALPIQDQLYRSLTNVEPPTDELGNPRWTRADYNASILHLLHDQETQKALEEARAGRTYRGDPKVLSTIRALRRALNDPRYREWTGRSMARRVNGTFSEIFQVHKMKPDAAGLHEARWGYVNDAFAAAFNKSILQHMLLQHDASGAPLVLAIPSGIVDTEEVVHPDILREHARRALEYYGYRLDPARGVTEQLQWLVNNRLGQGSFEKVASRYPSIAYFMAQKGNAADILKHIADEPYRMMFGDVDALEWLTRVTQWSKITSVGWSLFFPFALGESVIAGTGLKNNVLHPRGGFENLRGFWKDAKEIREALRNPGDHRYKDLEALMVEAGIQLSETAALDEPMGIADTDVNRIEDYVRRHHGEKAAEYTRKALRLWQGRWLSEKFFGDLFPAIKLWAAHRLMGELGTQLQIDTTTREGQLDVLRRIAPIINDAYGGQFWSRYIWATPKVRQILNLTLFAPNWTISAWNIAGGGALTGRVLGNTMTDVNEKFVFRQNWPAMAAVVMFGIPAALQLAIWAITRAGGDPDDEPLPLLNERGREDSIDITPLARLMPGYEGDPTGRRRFYMRFGKQAQEVIGDSGWLQTPIEQLLRKTSQPVRALIEQLTGESAGSDFALEFKGKGMLGWITSGEPGAEGLLTSRFAYLANKFIPMSWLTLRKTPEASVFAFLAPISKGMSMGRATEELIKILNTYAHQDQWTRIQALPSAKANLDALAPAVLDAVERNGYDPAKVLSAARGAVLGRLYGEFWNALNSGDTRKMEQLAIPITRLHGTLDGLQQSLKSREKQFRRPLSEEQLNEVDRVFRDLDNPLGPAV